MCACGARVLAHTRDVQVQLSALGTDQQLPCACELPLTPRGKKSTDSPKLKILNCESNICLLLFLLPEIYSALRGISFEQLYKDICMQHPGVQATSCAILELLLLSPTLHIYPLPGVAYCVCIQEFVIKPTLILTCDLCHLKNKQRGVGRRGA